MAGALPAGDLSLALKQSSSTQSTTNLDTGATTGAIQFNQQVAPAGSVSFLPWLGLALGASAVAYVIFKMKRA